MGLVMSVALVTLFNISVWKEGENKAVLDKPWQILIYFGVSALFGFLIQGSMEFPFSILIGITTVSVLTIISILYTIFWILLTRSENSIQNISQILPYFFAGFTTAISQIMLLNLLRNSIMR